MRYRWLNRKRCPHSRLQGIYGDRINHVGGWRLWCLDCERYIDGPVSLAASRRAETVAVAAPVPHPAATDPSNGGGGRG